MNISSIKYQKNEGWSDSLPFELDSKDTLVLVFGASEFNEDFEPISELVKGFSKSKIMGCSTAGEIIGESVNDGSLAVSVVKFDNTRISIACSPIENSDESYKAGEKIAKNLDEKDLKGILVLSDGLNVNGSELVKGLKSQISDNVVVTGGLAGDKADFHSTWVLKDGIPTENFISAVGFYGEKIRIGYGSKDGLDIFGIERKVTRSEKNVLYEIDGQPALELYKKYLGEEASELPASALFFPLSLLTGWGETKRTVRTILSVDEEEQSMTFAGDIPQGTIVQLMRSNIDRIIDGASDAAEASMERFQKDEEMLSIAISCIGRRLVLGERSEEELEAVVETLSTSAKQIGFYSYGEISPKENGYCDLHNQTMTLTTISEF